MSRACSEKVRVRDTEAVLDIELVLLLLIQLAVPSRVVALRLKIQIKSAMPFDVEPYSLITWDNFQCFTLTRGLMKGFLVVVRVCSSGGFKAARRNCSGLKAIFAVLQRFFRLSTVVFSGWRFRMFELCCVGLWCGVDFGCVQIEGQKEI